MKIRNGFVSNSSSSSFIVRFKSIPHLERDDSMIASEEDIRKLANYGFQLSRTDNPFNVDGKIVNPLEEKYIGFFTSLKYSVGCNQDIVLAFLLKNKIPFRASIHYDNDFYQYNRGDKNILMARNSGQVLAMYGADEGAIHDEKKMTPIYYRSVDVYDRDYMDEPYVDNLRGLVNIDNLRGPVKLDAEYVIKLKNTKYGDPVENED